MLLSLISNLGLSGLPQVQNPVLARASPISLGRVPLDSSDPFALPDRDYDHATVAINDDRDVVVAFHSSRTDVSASMKQVEIAYYQWQVGDTWLHKGTKTLGNMNFDPLFNTAEVKCERPDVVAVEDKFFVVWTRRYENVIGHGNQPAVMECAWVDLDQTQNIRVHQNGQALGLGVELDKHVLTGGTNDFWIKECGGVPDAVPLKETGNPYKVTVVYAHQTQFSGATLDRKFELRVVTCEMDATTFAVSKGTAQPQGVLVPQIQFNGISSASGSSGGLVLPELAVSSEDNAFWLAAERQIEVGTQPNVFPE